MMTDGSFSLSTTADTLLALEVTAALAESEKPLCWNYGNVFLGRGKTAEDAGDGEVAKAWRLLGQLCQIGMRQGNPGEPFQPLFQGPEGRSLLPSDLDQVSADAVRQLGFAVDDPELKARLLDITWERLRDPEAAREAVRNYMAAANRLFDPQHWLGYAENAERALRLAQQLRDQALLEATLTDVEQKVLDLDGGDPRFMTSRLMRLLHEFKKGDPERMIEIARKAADLASNADDFRRARAHLENLRRWRRMAKDQKGEREARIDIARSYEKEAELLTGAAGRELMLMSVLEQAHQAYRDVPGMRMEAEAVYGRLRSAQQRAMDTMQEIRSDGIDISDMVRAAREHVGGRSFGEALLALALIIPPTDFNKETANARELMEKYPLQGLFGGVKIERDGRVVAHRTVGIGEDQAEGEQALWERAWSSKS